MKSWWASPLSPFDSWAQVAKRLCCDCGLSASAAKAPSATAPETAVHATTLSSLVFMGLPDVVDRGAMRLAHAAAGEAEIQKCNGRFIRKEQLGTHPTS